jgi:hypothetical protein
LATAGTALIVVGISTGFIITLKQEMKADIKSGTYPASLSPTPVVYESSETGYRVHQGLFSAENGVERGYGWQYINQRSELTQSELEKLLGLEKEVEVGYIKTTKIKATDTTTYVLAQRGGPDQTEVWILRLAGAEAVRAAKQQIDRATDEASPLLDNAEDYVSAEEVGAVRKLNQGDPSARIATLAGQDTRETYDDLEVADKERFGRTLAEAGEEGWLEGEDITAVVEAVDEDRIRAKQVADAGDRIDALDDPAIAEETVSKKPVLGFEFIAELDGSADAKALFGQADSAQQVADFLDATETDAKEILDIAVRGAYDDILELSGPEQEVMAEVVVEEQLDGEDKFASDDIKPSEIADVANDTDLNQIQLIAKTGNGNIRYLEPEGMTHIRKRHIDGSQINSNADETTFFPLGQSVKRNGDTRPMPDAQITETDVKGIIRRVIENDGEESDYRLNQRGIRDIHVGIKENGNISTAFPVDGTNVRQWNRSAQEWRRWDSNTNSWKVWTTNPSISPRQWIPIKCKCR